MNAAFGQIGEIKIFQNEFKDSTKGLSYTDAEDVRAQKYKQKRKPKMAVAIPEDFDYLKESLDYNEVIIRDILRLKVENWAKFRHAIGVGTETSA
jgi:hypothetical protein